MKEENRKYAREAMDIVEHAANKIGSRLPGSDGEIELHKYMGEKLREIGIEPKTEEFAVSPRSGIGGLSYAGWSGVILSIGAVIAIACGFNKLWYALGALGLITIFWLVMSCFFYKTWFDMFFPQEISRNTLGVLEPETESTTTPLFFPVIQTHLGAGVTVSTLTSTTKPSLLWVLLLHTAK